MKSTTIVAALLGASVSVSARFIPRTEPDCEEKPGTPTSPIGGGGAGSYGSSGGSGTYGPVAKSYGPVAGTYGPVAGSYGHAPIGTGKPSTPVSPVVPIGTGTYGSPASYGASAGNPYGGGSSSGSYAPISTGSPSSSNPSGTNNTQGTDNSSGLVCGATSVTTHTVASGDTLTTIAQNYTSGICDIASLNNITNPNLIILGQTLQIPVGCTTPDNTSCVPPPTPNATETCVPGLPATYTLVSGDTLTSIAKDFNITLDALIGANSQISNPDLIDVGQVINVPVCPNSQCEIVGTYTIQSGDLFFDLAAKYNSRVGQIKALNPTVDPSKIPTGYIIILPQNCQNVTTAVA